MNFVAILFIVLGIYCLWHELRRVKGEKRIRMISISLTFFGFLCCIIPGLIIDNQYNISAGLLNQFVGFILTLISYIFIRIGYYRERRSFSVAKNRHTVQFGEKNIFLAAIVFGGISFVSLYLWCSGYGGIQSVMLLGNQIRASFVTSNNAYMFFKHFVPISIISSLLLYTDLFVNKNKNKRFAKYIILALSILISLTYIIANDGRMLAGTFFLYFFLVTLKHKYEVENQSISNIAIKMILIVAVIFFIILTSEKWFADYRQLDFSAESHSMLDTLMSEFHFIYDGLEKVVADSLGGIYHFTILNDFFNGLFAWLPTSLKPIALEDVWDYNTRIMKSGEYGQAPTSIVAQSFYDLYVIGVVIIPYLYSRLIARIEYYLEGNYSTFAIVLYTTLAFYFGKGMAYFSIYNIMINMFFIIISWVIYKYLISKV